jgi:hypothetical protein
MSIDPSQVQWDPTPTPSGNAIDPSKVQWDEEKRAPEETVGRVAGLGARSLMEHAAGIPDDILKLADPVGTAVRTVTGSRTPDDPNYKPSLSDFVHPEHWREAAHYFADKSGLPTPETDNEKLGSEAFGALSEGVLNPEAPIATALSSATGSAASEAARQNDVGPAGQAIAGIIGGSAGPVARYGASALTKAAFKGDSQDAVRQRQADAAGITDLSAGQATGNKLLQYIEGVSSRLWGGSPLKKLAQKQVDDTGNYASGMVDKLSGTDTPSPMSAGSAIERDIGKENDQPEDQTYFGSLRKKDEDAYQKVDQLVPADHPVNVAGTMRQLHNETALIPGAEPISRNFISPKVSKWKRDMDATIEQNAEKGRPYPVTDKLPADALPPPIALSPQRPTSITQPPATPPSNTGLGSLGGTPQGAYKPEPYSHLLPEPVSRPAAWNQPTNPVPLDWRDKSAFGKSMGVSFAPPQPLLPYSAARALKSQMGRKIDWTGNAKDRELNKSMINVWGNLRADIDHAAGQLSPEAKQAVQDANRTFQQNEATRKELARYINKTGGPESIFKAVTSGMKDGSTHLDRVLPALKPETQDLVRSTVLDRLGRPSAGSDAPFNPHTFLNNWNKQLSHEAKDSLFGTSGPSNDLRNSLDRLTKTIGNVKKGTELLNPSGSGEVVTKAAGVEAAWDAIKQLLMGKVFGAATLGLGVAANRGVSKWLANPKTVDWLNSATKAPTSAIPNLVNQLGKIDDPDARSLHDYLTQQQPQARASGGRTGPTDDELVERLMKRYRAAKRAEDASTKPLLEQPDAAIIHALKISGSRL